MKQSISLILAALLVGAHAAVVSSAGQSQKATPDQQEALKLKANLVEIRAVVTDKKGQPVEGLTKADFEVLEDGRAQEISFFSADRLGANSSPETIAPDRGVSSPGKPAAARTVVLFVDSMNLSLASVASLRPVLKRFVDEQISRQDVVAVVGTAGTLGLLQEFTTNKQVLKYAIDRLRPGSLAPESLFTPYLAARVLKRERNAVEAGKLIYEAEEGPLSPLPPQPKGLRFDNMPVVHPLVEAKALITMAEAAAKRRATLASLNAVADRLAELPGQRLVVVISEGFTSMTEEGEFQSDEVQSVIGRAGRSGVTIYALDARGVEPDALFRVGAKMESIPTSPRPRGLTRGRRSADDGPAEDTTPVPVGAVDFYLGASRADLQNGLTALTQTTGGKYFRNNNDLGSGLRQIVQENRVSYALAYYPADEKEEAKFRRLTVRVKGHSDYEVRTQKGYSLAGVARKEKAEALLTPEQRLMEALTAPLPMGDIDVTVVADYLETDADEAQLLLQTCISGNSLRLQRQEQGQAFNVELTTRIYDLRGNLVASNVETIDGQFTAERAELLKQNSLRHSRRFSLKPGLYQARVGLREAGTERIATAFSWVEIPDLKRGKVALSSVQLAESALATSGSTANGAFRYPKVRSGAPVFRRGNLFAYSLLLYNAPQNAAPEVRTEIYRDEKAIYEGGWEPLAARLVQQGKKGALLGGQFKLDFAPGAYELRVTVRDAKTKQETRRFTLFEVE